jgi:hypothetical protein
MTNEVLLQSAPETAMHGTKNRNYVNIGYTPMEVRRCHRRRSYLKPAGTRRTGCEKGRHRFSPKQCCQLIEIDHIVRDCPDGLDARLKSCPGSILHHPTRGPFRSVRRIPDAQRIRNKLKTYGTNHSRTAL